MGSYGIFGYHPDFGLINPASLPFLFLLGACWVLACSLESVKGYQAVAILGQGLKRLRVELFQYADACCLYTSIHN